MLGRCLAVFFTTHLLSVGSLTALLLLLQHALRNSSTAPTISAHDSLSFVHVVNVEKAAAAAAAAALLS